MRAHLGALVRKGYLKKADNISRGLEMTRRFAGGTGRVPLVGLVPAGGNPSMPPKTWKGRSSLMLTFLPKGESFSLTVKGDSMVEAGIHDRDVVIVRKQNVAQKGDIVVAIVNGEATVKRYFPEGQTIRLQPENLGLRADLRKPEIRRVPDRRQSGRSAQKIGLTDLGFRRRWC